MPSEQIFFTDIRKDDKVVSSWKIYFDWFQVWNLWEIVKLSETIFKCGCYTKIDFLN